MASYTLYPKTLKMAIVDYKETDGELCEKIQKADAG